MSLEADPISQQETERKAMELLLKFFRLFFTGTPVAVSGDTETLPLCDLYWAVQTVPKASEKPQIHTVFLDWKAKEHFSGDRKLVRADVMAQIIVRVAEPGTDGKNPDHKAMRVADGLKRLFESEKILLAQKGIHHCKVKRGPIALSINGMAARMLVVTFQLHYQAIA